MFNLKLIFGNQYHSEKRRKEESGTLPPEAEQEPRQAGTCCSPAKDSRACVSA